VVIFTSPEIADGREKAYPSVDNEYMTKTVRKKWTEGLENSLEIVKKFLYREFGDGDFYVCEVDVNNFSECFEAIVKALLKFHFPGKVGKHVWANLTGGTNVLNAALMQTAYLSGLIPFMYYTFVSNLREHGKFLKPFSRNKREFDFQGIYIFKTRFDEKYRFILEELQETKEEWLSDIELLCRLKRRHPEVFADMNLISLRRDFLNVMLGVERKGDRISGQEKLNRLSQHGEKILKILRSPLFTALTRRNRLSLHEIRKLINDLKIRKI